MLWVGKCWCLAHGKRLFEERAGDKSVLGYGIGMVPVDDFLFFLYCMCICMLDWAKVKIGVGDEFRQSLRRRTVFFSCLFGTKMSSPGARCTGAAMDKA